MEIKVSQLEEQLKLSLDSITNDKEQLVAEYQAKISEKNIQLKVLQDLCQ